MINQYTISTDDPLRASALIALAALGDNPTTEGLDAILYFMDSLGITPYRSDDRLPKERQEAVRKRVEDFFEGINQGDAISFSNRLKHHVEGINFMVSLKKKES